MKADLALTETAAAKIRAGAFSEDAARASDLTFDSIHTPRATGPGRSCF